VTTRVYLRVSTDKQDETSQRQIIAAKYPDNGGFEVMSDTASGGKPWQERALANMLEDSEAGDLIVVSEISRIARSTVGVLSFLEAATAKGVQVDAVNTGIKLDGSLSATIVVTIFAMVAQIERALLKERTKSALQARKANGLAVGRQAGATGKSNKLAGKYPEIQTMLGAGLKKKQIASVLSVSRQTLDTYINQQRSAQ